MHVLLSHFPPPLGWRLVGTLGAAVLLAVLLAVVEVHSQPAPRAEPPPTLTWNYEAPAPERFVIRRSIDGGTWQDVGVVPGTVQEWQIPPLPTSSPPVVAQYVVYAVEAGVWSDTSNRAIGTFGGEPRRAPATVTVVRADSAETQAGKHQAKLAGDAKLDTFWHTRWTGTTPAPLPHWIVLDLGAPAPVDGLAYLPRQDGSAQGRIVQYEISVSQDNTAWSEPVALGAWVWGPNALEQYVRWPAVEARYVRLTALSEASGGPWSAAAELGLYAGTPAPGPGPEGVALGECVATKQDEKITVLTCTKP